MSKKSARSRNWAFTSFKILDGYKILGKFAICNSDDGSVSERYNRYMCWGKEICPKTKKKHLQGWIQFHKPHTLSWIKKKMGKDDTTHWEPCKGSEIQNDKYCQKEGKYETFGKWTEVGTKKVQGQRTDLEAIYSQIKEGVTKEQLWEQPKGFQTYCKYRNGILDAIKHFEQQKRKEFRKVEVEYCYGPTGTGKTRYAMESENAFKIHGSDLKWFDGYNGETTLIIDEYANDIKITKLLGILDGYTLRLPIKGGFTYANWTKVIITSNLNKEELHAMANDRHRNALFRRINEFKKFEEIAQSAPGNTILEHEPYEDEEYEFDYDDLNL